MKASPDSTENASASPSLPSAILAEDFLYGLLQLHIALTQAHREQTSDIRTEELLILQTLRRYGLQTVGELQQLLGKNSPAAMTRILGRLANGTEGGPRVTRKINPRDRRKIDVQMTSAGGEVLDDEVRKITEQLRIVPPELLQEAGSAISRILQLMRTSANGAIQEE